MYGRLKNLKYTILCFFTKDRPPANIWKKIDQSRDYKNGNQLREYQLEGLNWLLFNWYNRYVVYLNRRKFSVLFFYMCQNMLSKGGTDVALLLLLWSLYY